MNSIFKKKNPKVNPGIKNMSKLVRLGMSSQWPSLSQRRPLANLKERRLLKILKIQKRTRCSQVMQKQKNPAKIRLNGRRCEQRPLVYFNSRRSQCQPLKILKIQ